MGNLCISKFHCCCGLQAGTQYLVRPEDVTLVLPGSGYKRSDLTLFLQQASLYDLKSVESALEKRQLKQTSSAEQYLSLGDVAHLLVGERDASHIYAVHRLLSTKPNHFRQVTSIRGCAVSCQTAVQSLDAIMMPEAKEQITIHVQAKGLFLLVVSHQMHCQISWLLA